MPSLSKRSTIRKAGSRAASTPWAGLHRRWGITPRPEGYHINYSSLTITALAAAVYTMLGWFGLLVPNLHFFHLVSALHRIDIFHPFGHLAEHRMNSV